MSLRAIALVAILLTTSGCSLVADPAPETVPEVRAPRVEQADPQADRYANVRLPVLARDSAERKAREMTVRVRNSGCLGVGTGSGFALDEHTLITNRHVLAGADDLEVNTWDGRSLTVTSASVGRLGDIGVANVAGRLPRSGTYGPRAAAGDRVVAVGYPLGGELTLSPGTVVDRVDGDRFGIPGSVLRLTARVQPGNSGGPVLDASGRVIAVVFAIEIATRFALAIPADTLRELSDRGGLEAVPPCGSE